MSTRALGVLLAFSLVAPSAAAQTVVESWADRPGFLRIGPEPERRIPFTERGFTLLLPEGDRPPDAVLVFLDGWRTGSDVADDPESIDRIALDRGIAVLHFSTGNPLDFYFDDADLDRAARRIHAIVEEHAPSVENLFLAGLSLGGTRAARLAIHLVRNEDRFDLRPTALALVDAPLDWIRMWRTETRAKEEALHPAAADEGHWVTYLLETNLGGTPDGAREAYVTYSPYVHGEPDGGNAVALRDVAVRAYHEPDVEWWIEHRGKDYYDMNSLDLAAFVNRLRILGNERAELVTTHDARDDPSSSPHTWDIVDDRALVEWLLSTRR